MKFKISLILFLGVMLIPTASASACGVYNCDDFNYLEYIGEGNFLNRNTSVVLGNGVISGGWQHSCPTSVQCGYAKYNNSDSVIIPYISGGAIYMNDRSLISYKYGGSSESDRCFVWTMNTGNSSAPVDYQAKAWFYNDNGLLHGWFGREDVSHVSSYLARMYGGAEFGPATVNIPFMTSGWVRFAYCENSTGGYYFHFNTTLSTWKEIAKWTGTNNFGSHRNVNNITFQTFQTSGGIRMGIVNISGWNGSLEDEPEVDLIPPVISNQDNWTSNGLDYIMSARSGEEGQCTLWGNWSGDWAMQESLLVTTSVFNFTSISMNSANSFKWGINCSDGNGNEAWGNNITFISAYKSIVTNIAGIKPFYHNGSTTEYQCGNMDDGDACVVTFWVDASGYLNITHEFYGIVNSDDLDVFGQETSRFNITIVTDASPAIYNIQDYTNDALTYTFAAQTDESATCTIYGNWSGSWGKQENFFVTAFTAFNSTPVTVNSDSNYLWSLNCSDSNANENRANNYTLTSRDTIPAVLAINSLLDSNNNLINSTSIISENENVTLNINVTSDTIITQVFVVIWDTVAETGNVLWQGFLSLFSGDLFSGIWTTIISVNQSYPLQANYTVYANDSYGNIGNISGNLNINISMHADNVTISPDVINESLSEVSGSWEYVSGYNGLPENSSVYEWYINGTSILSEPNLVSYWKLDQNAQDTQGSNDNGAFAGAKNVTGKIRGAFSFNATLQDRINFTNAKGLDLTGNFTASVWIKPSEISSSVYISKGGGQPYGWQLLTLTPQNVFAFRSNNNVVTSTTVMNANQWYLVTVIVNSTSGSLIYINGRFENSSNFTIQPNTGAPFTIGASSNSVLSNSYFSGIIDEVMVWNRTLTAQEISDIYNMTLYGQIDQSGANHSIPYLNARYYNSSRTNLTFSVIPFDGTQYGTQVNSPIKTIIVDTLPELTDSMLVSSNGSNRSSGNLELHNLLNEYDGDHVTNITNWYLNGNPIALLNMPFEASLSYNLIADSYAEFDANINGANHWYYYRSAQDTNSYTLLLDSGSVWTADGAAQGAGNEYLGVSLSGGHPGSTTYGDEVRAWNSTVSGNILINSTVYDANPSCGGGITYIIKKNSELLFNNSYPNNFTSTNVQAMVNVNKGDMLYFRINRGADNSCDSTTELVKIYAMSNAKDYAQGNNGNVYNATWSSSSGYNGLGAYDFNGASSYINAGDIDYMDTSPTLSGCAWVYHDTSNNDDTIFKKSVAQTEGIIFYRQNFQTATGKSDVYGIFVADSVDTSSALLTSANLSSQLNNWTYVCFTYLEGSSTGLRLYVNGIEAPDSPVSVSGITAHNADSEPFLIGANWTTSTQSFDGRIDEIMVWNRTLSSAQIQALYERKYNLLSANELRKGDVWYAKVTPNDGKHDGETVTSNNITILNGLPVASSVIISPNVVNTSVSKTAGSWIYTDSDNDQENATVYEWYINGTRALSKGLVGYWDFDSKGYDKSGTGNNGVVVDITNISGKIKNAFEFNRTGGSPAVTITDHVSIEPTQEISISMWFKPNIINKQFTLMSKSAFNNRFIILNTNSIRYYQSNGTSLSVNTATGLVVSNKWQHVAGTYDGANIKIYYNGEFKNATPATGPMGLNNANLVIGAYSLSQEGFNGSIDEVKIWNRSLTAQEISDLYNMTFYGQIDQSGANHTINNLTSNYYGVGTNLTFGVTPFDSEEYGEQVNSSVKSVS